MITKSSKILKPCSVSQALGVTHLVLNQYINNYITFVLCLNVVLILLFFLKIVDQTARYVKKKQTTLCVIQ